MNTWLWILFRGWRERMGMFPEFKKSTIFLIVGWGGKVVQKIMTQMLWIVNYKLLEWTPGVGDGQGGLACCDSWGRKELDTTERLNWTELNSNPCFKRKLQAWRGSIWWSVGVLQTRGHHSLWHSDGVTGLVCSSCSLKYQSYWWEWYLTWVKGWEGRELLVERKRS